MKRVITVATMKFSVAIKNLLRNGCRIKAKYVPKYFLGLGISLLLAPWRIVDSIASHRATRTAQIKSPVF
ncbi:MAG: hypothetical protein J5755_03410, partial [Clostridia bacterium]|nr:hypothetical protein [Clostridia bacterium]